MVACVMQGHMLGIFRVLLAGPHHIEVLCDVVALQCLPLMELCRYRCSEYEVDCQNQMQYNRLYYLTSWNIGVNDCRLDNRVVIMS